MYVCLEYYMKFYIIHKFYVYVRISYNILYGIKYMITYQTFVWRSWYYICSTSKFILMSSQCKFLSQLLCKATSLTCDLGSFEILVKHKKLCLLSSLKISAHLTSLNERSCYFLEITSNWDLNTKWLTICSQQLQTPWNCGRQIIYMSSIFSQDFNSINDDHKELLF
jgi:hypothetical protein